MFLSSLFLLVFFVVVVKLTIVTFLYLSTISISTILLITYLIFCIISNGMLVSKSRRNSSSRISPLYCSLESLEQLFRSVLYLSVRSPLSGNLSVSNRLISDALSLRLNTNEEQLHCFHCQLHNLCGKNILKTL